VTTNVPKISDFAEALAADDELMLRYIRDPDGVMSEFQLDPTQKYLINNGTAEQIRVAVAAETGQAPTIIVRVIVR